jgi:hypothetical protein
VALDLHFLLSFYGVETSLEPQRLLGCVVRTLHARPILTRDTIRNTVTDPQNPEDPNPTYPYLFGSDLADEVELVKFTPIPLSLEELSKLWSVFFQTHYTLSIAYHATVVLVDANIVPVTPLPVRERLFYPSAISPIIVDRAISQSGTYTPITDASTIVIHGRGLRGENMKVRIGEAEVTPIDMNDSKIELPLSLFAAGELRPGVQGLQVIQQRRMGLVIPPDTEPKLHTALESNAVPIVLRPRIDGAITKSAPVLASDGTYSTTLTLPVTPSIGVSQRVVLLLNEKVDTEPKSYSFIAGKREDTADAIEFEVKGVKGAEYLARIQVDGAESLLEVDVNDKYSTPAVTI